MKYSDKGIMSFAGSIRGSIAFGLAVSLKIENSFHKSILVSSTLALVMITTLVFGALMPIAIRYFKSSDELIEVKIIKDKDPIKVIQDLDDEEEDSHENEHKFDFVFTHPNFQEE